MERLEGSLRALLDGYLSKARQPPLELALQWLAQTAAGVAEVHEANVVHSDIKAANTLVDKRREAKIGDLGAGRVTRGISATASLAGSTSAGNARGSVLWLASELVDEPSLQPSKQSDVYAWGVMAWEILSCRLPYHDEKGQLTVDVTSLRNMTAIVIGKLRPDLAAVRADAPPAVVALMQRCWAAEPRERPTMAEVADTLEAAAAATAASEPAAREARKPASTAPRTATTSAVSGRSRGSAAQQRCMSAMTPGGASARTAVMSGRSLPVTMAVMLRSEVTSTVSWPLSSWKGSRLLRISQAMTPHEKTSEALLGSIDGSSTSSLASQSTLPRALPALVLPARLAVALRPRVTRPAPRSPIFASRRAFTSVLAALMSLCTTLASWPAFGRGDM